MSSTGLQYTNLFIREKVEEYILEKLGMEVNELTAYHKKELESFSKTFFSTFLKKRSEVSKNISRIQQSAWGQNLVSFPQSLLGTPAPSAAPTPPLASQEKATAVVPPQILTF